MTFPIELKRIESGFRFGPADFEAWASHNGAVIAGVTTPRDAVQIYVTPTGLIRIHRSSARRAA